MFKKRDHFIAAAVFFVLSAFLLFPRTTSCEVLHRNMTERLHYLGLADAQEEDKPGAVSRFFDRYLSKDDGESDGFQETGWFVGPMFLLFQSEMSPFSPMTDERGIDSFEDSTFLYGIMGGFIRGNWRFGALYLSGGHSTKGLVSGQTREASLSFYGGGVFFEYNREIWTEHDLRYPARIPYFREGWLVGVMAGIGQLAMEAKGADLGPRGKWLVEEQLLVLYPYAGFWTSPVYDWLWIQLDVGYMYYNLDPSDEKYVNAGTRMVDTDFTGGIQVGLKITLGDNPNTRAPVGAGPQF